MVIDQPADVMEFDLVPNFHGLLMGFEFALQPPDTFLNAQRVKLNPLTLTALLPMPIGGFQNGAWRGRIRREKAGNAD